MWYSKRKGPETGSSIFRVSSESPVRLVWREEGKQVGNEAGEVTRGCSKEFHSYSE